MNDRVRQYATTIGLLAALVMLSVGPVAAMQTGPITTPTQTTVPFDEMLPSVYVYWQWWNASSDDLGPVPVEMRNEYNYEYYYMVEDTENNTYWILEDAEYNSTSDWSFSNLLVTIVLDPDGSFISWLSTQPTAGDIWMMYWWPTAEALTGDEVLVYSSFYYSTYNYSYSYSAQYTWMDENWTVVDPGLIVPLLKEEYQWASFMNGSYSDAQDWYYCGFGYDVSEMTMAGDQTQWMQHYFSGLSVFNDTDDDGVVDIAYDLVEYDFDNDSRIDWSYYVINYTSSELKYDFFAQSAAVGSVQTPFVNANGQIEWSTEVVDIEGIFSSRYPYTIACYDYAGTEPFAPPETYPAKVDRLKMTYRFEVNEKAAVLKIDQLIGDFREPLTGGILPLAEGLSLTLNYWSSFSSSDLLVSGDDQTIAPTTVNMAEPVVSGGISFNEGDNPLASVQFGGTYVWGKDNSTHDVGTAIMPVYLYAFAAEANPSLSGVATGSTGMMSGSYYYSSCYGEWDGYSIVHDPIFTVFPQMAPGDVSGRISGILYTSLFLGGSAVVVLSAVCIRINRVRESA